MRFIPNRFLVTAAAAALVAALTACNTDPYATDPGDDPVPAGNENSELTVTAPAAGDTVAVPFEVTVAAGVELGAVEDGVHHVHVWFGEDEETLTMHFGDTATVEEAPEGETTMWVQLADPEHELVGGPVEIALTVEAAEAEDDQSEEEQPPESPESPESPDAPDPDDGGGNGDGY